MKIKLVNTSIDVEVILFNEETERVILLSKKVNTGEFKSKQVIPVHSSGRMINFQMEYKGEYYSSYVAGNDNVIVGIGHVIEDISEEEILKSVESKDFEFVDSEKESDILLLFIENKQD